MNQLLIPSTHAAAYTTIPVVFSSDNAYLPKYKYIINVCYNECQISTIVPSVFGVDIYSLITTATPHNFKVGDKIFIYLNQYVGYYNILEIIDSTSFKSDLTFGIPYDTTPSNLARVCNFFNYKMPQDPEGVVKLDLASAIKNYVTSDLFDSSIINGIQMTPPIGIFDGSDSRFQYFIVLGDEYKYELPFYDNGVFTGSTLGFFNPDITTLDGIPFQVGDRISVMQDLFEWQYDYNFFSSGRVGLTSSNPHNWEVGDIITVYGQETYPTYNGLSTVFEVPDNFNIVLDTQWIGLTPAEGGSVFGTPMPQYNRDYTITGIYIDSNPAIGFVILTDGAVLGTTQPIGGKITYLFDTLVSNLSIDTVSPSGSTYFNAFNARMDRKDYRKIGPYSKDLYKDDFVQNGFSSIIEPRGELQYLGTTKALNRVDLTSKGFLLYHSEYSDITIQYNFYNKENVFLGESQIPSTGMTDIYVPSGVVQVLLDPNRADVGSFVLDDDISNIKYYTINASYISGSTQPIKFAVDCCGAGLDQYNLVWKDALGSWLSYPFKYVATESTDVIRSNYYRREGNFVDNGSTWDYTIPNLSRGEKTFNTQSRNKYKLTSGWVKDRENILFEDLIKSTEVFMQLPSKIDFTQEVGEYLIDEFGNYITDEFGNYIIVGSAGYYEYVINQNELVPVVLETTNIEYGNTKNFQIYQYQPVVRVAYNDYRF